MSIMTKGSHAAVDLTPAGHGMLLDVTGQIVHAPDLREIADHFNATALTLDHEEALKEDAEHNTQFTVFDIEAGFKYKFCGDNRTVVYISDSNRYMVINDNYEQRVEPKTRGGLVEFLNSNDCEKIAS